MRGRGEGVEVVYHGVRESRKQALKSRSRFAGVARDQFDGSSRPRSRNLRRGRKSGLGVNSNVLNYLETGEYLISEGPFFDPYRGHENQRRSHKILVQSREKGSTKMSLEGLKTIYHGVRTRPLRASRGEEPRTSH